MLRNNKLNKIIFTTFLIFSLFLFFQSCTLSPYHKNESNNIVNSKVYENSYYLSANITDSIKILNTTIKIPETINNNKYYDYEKYEKSAKIFNIEKINIHYQLYLPAVKPKGKILLVHGFAGSTFTYHTLAPMLANKGYVVVSIDLPNFGYSERLKIKLNSNCFADLIYQFITNFDNIYNEDILKDIENSWNIIGHSMSGRILIVFANKYKEKLDNLILISPALSNSGNFPLITKIIPFNIFLNFYIQFSLKKENFAKILEKVYNRKPEQLEIDSYLTPLLIPDTISYVLYMLDVEEDIFYNPENILNKIEKNILLIWGEDDKIVPFAKSMRFIDLIKNKVLKTIENSGHNSMETDTESVFNFINEFIK